MILRILASLLLAVPAAAAAQAVTPEQLRRHIDILASDAFEGRAPGTAGERKTTDYIVAQWRALGLQPAGEGGGWYQPVALVNRTPRTQSVDFRGRKARAELDQAGIVLVGRGAQQEVTDAPLLFAGYGTAAPKGGYKGAVVLLLHESPQGVPSYEERADRAAAAGASAVLAVYPKEASWRWVQRSYERGLDERERAPMAPIEGAVTNAAAVRLAAASGLDLDRLAAGAAAPGFRAQRLRGRISLAVATDIVGTVSNNVVGRLPGSAGGEAVMFLGHWDHIGICRDEGEADRICNGAVDNASGIAALIEIARALAQGPRPARDILFLATTAEEMGLLGAAEFAASPPVPLAGIVAAFNLDTIAIGPKGEKVAVIGRGRAALDAVVDATIAAAGRTLDTDGEADAFVTRQDGWALARAGVPALMVGGSFSDMAKLNAFLAGPYHKASDNPGPHILLDGAAEDAELMVALGRALGDPARYPAVPDAPEIRAR